MVILYIGEQLSKFWSSGMQLTCDKLAKLERVWKVQVINFIIIYIDIAS